MNHNETEIPIIDGWIKIRVVVSNSEMFLPSDEILDRLIRFPTSLYIDSYNLDKFRIKPQVFDGDSQLLLQSRSNQIVDYLLECPLTDYESKIVKWCQDNNRNSSVIIFYKKLVDYCELILPGLNPNIKKDRIIAAVSRGDWNPADDDFRERYKNVDWVYWDKRKRDEKALINRFSEYGGANGTINWIVEKIGDDLLLDEYDQINKERKWFENHRNNLWGKNGSLRKFQGTLPLTLPEGTLTQCLFCYRFHLQYLGGGSKKSSLSRCCDRDECKKKNHYWENDLQTWGTIPQADVPLSGF